MHRIDTATATPDHKFTEGDPAVPVAATTVSAEWLNAVQEELVAVITGAGLELKKSDNGQLWQAIGQLITNAKPGLATKAKPGLVQVGGGLNITPEGLLSVLAASVTQAGIVQLASGLSDSTTTAPTCKAVKDAIESKLSAVNVPVGGILAFSGTFGGEGNRFPIPLGEDAPDMHWCLCDGTTTNGLPVPDLRGRMIRGASDSVPAGSTGGSEKHSHSLSGTVGETTLSVAQIANHTHVINSDMTYRNAANIASKCLNYIVGEQSEATGGSQPHTHALSGASGEASTLPPYYALALIMRIA
ncbi:tail fiber protein [Desulfovibrio piger]|uniref:tail fiber protein n=1 Tax=Desulfovibrio piger TaxID=901 RepID=UPI00195AB4E6|nr:tail fiber protein [Desulfovibrio piger]MBM6835330.1 tail fiber protein [Desulfovibrio piger]